VAQLENSDYLTDASISNLQNAIDNANAVIGNPDATPGLVTQAINQITAATTSLQLDTSILRDIIEGIHIYPALFTTDSFDAFMDVLEDAIEFLATTQPSEMKLEDLQMHAFLLQSAIDNLVPRFDLEEEGMTEQEFWNWLEEIRNTISGGNNQPDRSPDTYTPETWDNYRDAHEHLQNLLNSATATIQELRDALAALEAARDALAERGPAPSSEPTWADDNLWWLLVTVGGAGGILAGLMFVMLERSRRMG